VAINTISEKEWLEWYIQNKELYNACGSSMQRLLTTLLQQAEIPVHSIQYRIKEQESFINKCQNSRYTAPLNEITDVCGLRIITYTNKDVDDICKIIEKHFFIDWNHSVNKAELLHENEVGYLSVHYIAKLNQARAKLEEYMPFCNIRFEIQVRTLLQHAWAEIEHDRSYKFSGELPQDIKRRFFLVAGALELLDREFNILAREIEQYAVEVHSKTKSGEFDFDINSTSLFEYLNVKLKDYPDIERSFSSSDKKLIQELKDCGITKISDLDKIMDAATVKKVYDASTVKEGTNFIGFLRDLLMVIVPETYFGKAWKHHWRGMHIEEYDRLVSINPNLKKFENLFEFIL